jgi:hypothetical protein
LRAQLLELRNDRDDLLEACKSLTAMIAAQNAAEGNIHPIFEGAFKDAQAAIAKAESGAP